MLQQELLPAEDSALIAGLGADHEELRARVVDAGKAINEANDKGWTFVDRYRVGKVLDLNDEETKRFNEL
eukprot:1194592-Prorocentrum_minimum.AAC.1